MNFSLTLPFKRPRVTGLLAALLFVPLFVVQADITLTPYLQSRKKLPVNSISVRMGSFGAPAINSRGTVAFLTTCYGSGVSAENNSLVARVQNAKGRVIAREGITTAPNGSFLGKINPNVLVSDSVRICWSGVFYDRSGVTVSVNSTRIISSSRTGVGVSLSNFPQQEITTLFYDFNNRNAVSLEAGDLSQPDTPPSIFRDSLAGSTVLVSEGNTAIGLPLGAEYESFGDPTLDDNNFVYFAANISNTDSLFDGIWYGRNGDPQPLVQEGQKAPGGGNATFTAFASPSVPSPDGKSLGFAGSTGSGSNEGIWVVNVATKAVTTVATAGQRVAGYANPLANLQPPAITSSGQMVFGMKESVSGAGASDFTRVDALFYVSKPGAAITKVIARGDTFTVNGQATEVIDIRFSPITGMAKSGKFAFTASFANRTSIVYIATP